MLLAIETSTSRSSVALADPVDGTLLAASELGRDRRHGEFVAPAIAQLLAHLGATVGDLTVVAAGIGPGLYTGLRVGLVTAVTLATARDLPCVGVAGPDAIAHGLRHADRDVVVALDARRRELYAVRYRPDPAAPLGVRELVPLAVLTPADALADEALTGGEVLLAGDGVGALLAAADGAAGAAPVALAGAALAGPAHAQPTAAGLVPLAVAAVAAGDVAGPDSLRPLYLREADARIGWEQRGRLRGGAGRPTEDVAC